MTDVLPGAVDVHRHYLPRPWVEALPDWRDRGGNPESHLRAAAHWSVDKMIADMDDSGIGSALLSLPNPGVDMREADSAEDAELARACNLDGAKLVRQHPTRLGFLAAVPMRNAGAALAEIDYAFDELGADGLCLYTSADVSNLGDAETLPILEALNKRGATILVHPSTPSCCEGFQGLHPLLLELPFDTARAIARLHAAGTLRRLNKLNFIFCHAGGALPGLAHRLVLLGGAAFADGQIARHSNVFYDTALTLAPQALECLRNFVGSNQILFGTDHPFGRTGAQVQAVSAVFSKEDQYKITRTNPSNLFRRLIG